MAYQFEENVELDAVLVHADIAASFEMAAIGLGLTASEAFQRAKWLKVQSDDYIEQVADKVAERLSEEE